MKKVLILFGGVSSEHEVSCRSAQNVLEYIDRDKNEVYTVGITKDGRWLFTGAQGEDIADGRWEQQQNLPATLSCDRVRRGLVVFDADRARYIDIDVVFPLLHGENGEDGRLQGLLELAGLPFIGPGMRAGANSMDKATAKILLSAAGIRQADYLIFKKGTDPERIVAQVESKFVYPVFVKPSANGSSCGVSKAKNQLDLIKALGEAFKFDNKILVEEFIDGREIEVAVFGDKTPYASVCGEIVADGEFYDYRAKYVSDATATHVPADLPEKVSDTVRRTAVKVFETLECRGMSRVDFFVLKDGSVVLNELNAIPGFTGISMYPKLMMYSKNIEYSQLIEALLETA